MRSYVSLIAITLFFVIRLAFAQDTPNAKQTQQEKRIPWTTSHVTGTPESPHPYKIVRAFPKLTFRDPLLITMAPGGNRFFVGEQAGKIFSFANEPNVEKADLFLDVTKDLQASWDQAKVKNLDALYGLVFHPQFAKNRYCYVCYVLNSKKNGEPLPDGSRVSRFVVTDTDPPHVDPKSEKVMITWLAGGHNGGDLHFGNDGYLYISTGDSASPNPPDRLNTGQDISDLMSSVLRIDVDHEDKDKPYAIPADNPFLSTPKARPEVWAYGFRNPWRMSFDRPTGDLWVGDVGWELWEMIYKVKKGGNYGWPIMEGPQPVKLDGKRGPTPISPPAIALPHAEAASITGGYVYRGKRLKDLVGAYIFGDWVTRKLWATRFDGDKIVSHVEIAQGVQRVVAFGVDHENELYFLNHDSNGTIHQLVPNEAVKNYQSTFPRQLSETGLFASVKDQVPAPGVLPFSINAEQWADHAVAQRLVGLPGTSAVKLFDKPAPMPDGGFFSSPVFFPKDGVLAKTLSVNMEAGNPISRRHLETQILHFDGSEWRGYTYAWNDEQTDATLVGAAGMERTFTVMDPKAPGGRRQQTWQFASRGQCITCHNPWTGGPLAFNPLQLVGTKGTAGDDQLTTFKNLGLVGFFRAAGKKGKSDSLTALPPTHLTNPYDKSADINDRARSYLHVNCSHCHQFGAGGTAMIELRSTYTLDDTHMVEVHPLQGAFDMKPAAIVTPGDPYCSVLYYRLAKMGPGHMPHIGSTVIDDAGLNLIHDWIRQMPTRKDDRALLEKLGNQAKGANRDQAINQLLSSTSSALLLAHLMEENKLPEPVRVQVLSTTQKLTNSQVRDLFERFLPDEQRVKRLGSTIRPETILALKGDVQRGKELFFKTAGLQCVNCHRAQGNGSTLGPDLTQIGKKYTRAQILESILEPSKFVEPKFVTYLAETNDGKILTGLLVSKSDDEVVLRSAQDKEIHIPAKNLATLQTQPQSLMPEQLFRDLTAVQAADLVDYLASLKE